MRFRLEPLLADFASATPVYMSRAAADPRQPRPTRRHRQLPVTGERTSDSALRSKVGRSPSGPTTADHRALLSNLPDQLPVSRAEIDIVTGYFSDVIVAVLGAANDN